MICLDFDSERSYYFLMCLCRLLLGFMGTTAFLSMWISNTATAAMMLPIANAVLEEIKEENDLSMTTSFNGRVRYTSGEEGVVITDETIPNSVEGSRTTLVTLDGTELTTDNGDSGTEIDDNRSSNTETSQLLLDL